MKLKTSRSGNVPTKFLKDNVIACIFNKSIEKGYFKSILKTAIVSPIYKGEGSRSDPSNYRPISVLLIIARVFERLIHQQLYPYLNKFLWKSQSGFRSLYSAETASLKATNNWLLNIDKGKYNLALFLDMKKAFDHNILLRKLEYYGIIHKKLNWLTSYLSDRLQYCKIDGQISSKLKVRLGIPQGSCLGPLLFLVYINDLPQCLANSEPDIYADDTSLTNNEKDLAALENKVNRDLFNIEKWLYANKLQLNAVKTKYMIIATPHRLKRKQKLCIKIGSKEIEEVDVRSYLGITVDNRLKWNEHIHILCKKISSAIAALRQVRFLPREALLSIYRTLIESRIRYCCTIWGNCNAKLKNRVQKLQNRAARTITNAKSDADNDELLNTLNWLNVQQLIDYTAALQFWKAVNDEGPQYIRDMFIPLKSIPNYNTRAAANNFRPPVSNLEYGSRRFSQYGCKIWNSLPKDIQATKSLESFKENLKKHFLGQKLTKT